MVGRGRIGAAGVDRTAAGIGKWPRTALRTRLPDAWSHAHTLLVCFTPTPQTQTAPLQRATSRSLQPAPRNAGPPLDLVTLDPAPQVSFAPALGAGGEGNVNGSTHGISTEGGSSSSSGAGSGGGLFAVLRAQPVWLNQWTAQGAEVCVALLSGRCSTWEQL